LSFDPSKIPLLSSKKLIYQIGNSSTGVPFLEPNQMVSISTFLLTILLFVYGAAPIKTLVRTLSPEQIPQPQPSMYSKVRCSTGPNLSRFPQ
jgi:hypothetical protein